MSTYTFRLRSPAGLENCLVKELKQLNLAVNVHKEKGRPFVQVQGDQRVLWKMIYKSRIADRIQLRMTKPFLVRGEKELDIKLKKLPWMAYLPIKEFDQYKMPQTTCKSYSSKLFHTKMVRESLLKYINELPIQIAYNDIKLEKRIPFKKFKTEWL